MQVRDKLLAACTAAGVRVRYGAGLADLQADCHAAGGWRCALQDGSSFTARRVVSCMTQVSCSMLKHRPTPCRALLDLLWALLAAFLLPPDLQILRLTNTTPHSTLQSAQSPNLM